MRNLLRLIEKEIDLITKYERASYTFKDNLSAKVALEKIEMDHREAVNLLSRQLVKLNTGSHDDVDPFNDELGKLKDEEQTAVHEYLSSLEAPSGDQDGLKLIKSSLLPKARSHIFVLDQLRWNAT